jgi:acetate kinase
MTETILILNAGSSSIKFQLFAVAADDKLTRCMKGQIDGIGTRPRLFAKAKEGETLVDRSWPASAVADAAAALDKAVTWLQQQLGGELPSAIGHRVAHGGPDFSKPTVVDDAVLEQLERLVPLAPPSSAEQSCPHTRDPPAPARVAPGRLLRHRLSSRPC